MCDLGRWWEFNHPYRNDKDRKFILSSEQEENLIGLLQLYDTNNPEESILRAEILRELSRFDECLKELDQKFDDDYLKVVNLIKKLAGERVNKVVKIN